MIKITIGRVIVRVSAARSRSTAQVTITVFNRLSKALAGLLARKQCLVRTRVTFLCLKRLSRSSTESFKWSKLPPMVTILGSKFSKRLTKKRKRTQTRISLQIEEIWIMMRNQAHRAITYKEVLQMWVLVWRTKSARSRTFLKYILWRQFNNQSLTKRRRSLS